MAKVKLFRMINHSYYDSYDNDNTISVLSSAVADSDWEEVTDEELIHLRAYILREYPSRDVVIVEKMDGATARTVDSINTMIKKENARAAEEAAERERKKQERILKKQAKTEAQERELLAALQNKYGET